MFNLSGKKALVTGASGGLGEGIIRSLAAQGAIIALSGTRGEALEKLASTLPDPCPIFLCNLNRAEEVDALIPRVEEVLGQVDILVNNAGITRDNLLLRLKNEDFEEVIQVNLEAPFQLMRAAVRGMMKRRWGRILNITSIVGITGNPGQANYCASKAGIIGMSKAIAQEVASRGITVNCIAPGFMVSAMTSTLLDAHKEKLLASIPQRRMGSGEDIGATVVFLASNEASYITGQTLHVNGGMAMV